MWVSAGEEVLIGDEVSIGDQATIGDRARIGAYTRIKACGSGTMLASIRSIRRRDSHKPARFFP